MVSYEPSSKTYIIKTVLIGEGGAGKTCIAERFSKNTFNEGQKMTLGAAFQVKDLAVRNGGALDSIIKYMMWDLAGQERFNCVRPGYYKGTQACLLVYDIGRPGTFYELPKWMEEMSKHVDESIPIVLVGNKADARKREDPDFLVSYQTALEYSQLLSQRSLSHGGQQVPYFETSAKDGTNVLEVFTTLGKMILHRIETKENA
jgi:small GTP-binding protein